MRKITAIMKYQLLNLKRKRIIIIMLALFLFGMEQALWTARVQGEFHLNLVTILKTFWLPINLTYIPLLIINEIIGSGDQEIFEVLNISKRERFLGKLFTSAAVSSIIIIVYVIIFVAIAIIAKAPFNYSIYLISMTMLNIVTGLLCCSSFGLLVGEAISKRGARVVSFLLIILFFLATNNFYRVPDLLMPIMKIDPLPSTFQLFALDRLTVYHFILWNLIALLILFLIYNFRELSSLKLMKKVILCFLALGIFTSIFSGLKYNPTRYFINCDNINENYENQSALTSGFTIENYDMKLKLKDIVSNECNMDIVINKNDLNQLYLNLYHTLKPSLITVNGKQSKFSTKGDMLTIVLPDEYKDGERIRVYVKYSGVINTGDEQGKLRYFVNNNAFFLSDYFPWYPKPEFMGNIKKYKIYVENNSGNIYSSLNENNGVLEGEGKEIFILKNNLLSKHIYNGIEFIGNTEQIATDARCKALADFVLHSYKATGVKRILFTPGRDKEYLIYDLYDGQILFGQIDYGSHLHYGR